MLETLRKAIGLGDPRSRAADARRALLLSTLVELGREIGATLDAGEVFRALCTRLKAVMALDSCYAATISETDPTMLRFRYLYDEGVEREPQELPIAKTMGGVAILQGRPLQITDTERIDRAALGLPPIVRLTGSELKRSFMAVPIRLRGKVIGAISVQALPANAHGPQDLELLEAIANEAAIAIERADLHERTSALSKRLFELHRIGIEMAAVREIPGLAKLLVESVTAVIGASGAAVYLVRGDEIEVAASTADMSKAAQRTFPLAGSATERALDSGQPLFITDPPDAPAITRQRIEESGQHSVAIYPMRSSDESVGVLYLGWRERHILSEDERELIEVIAGMGASALRGIRAYGELEDAYLSTVSALTATIQARDGYREDHLRHVAADAVALGQKLGLTEGSLRELRYAALFHSLGKIGVPSTILSKPGPLTAEERRLLQEHPILAARILESMPFLRRVVPIVRHASERWDGSGYPEGLAGEAIPRSSRILHLVVCYNAMLVDRPYRAALGPERTLAELRALSGKRYDPRMVEAFTALVEARGTLAAAEEQARGTPELAVLAEITPEFHTILDLDQLLERVVGILEHHFPGAQLAIYLEEERTGELVVRAAAGDPSGELARGRLPRGRGIVGWVYLHGEPALVDDARKDPRLHGSGYTRSLVAVPLLSRERTVGVLAARQATVAAFGQRDLTLLQAVAGQISAAIEVAGLHERLRAEANTDGLTGIHNYRYFYDRLEEEIARADRRSEPLSVAYFDIDGLKTVNDTHGHLAGDAVLRALGRILEEHVRQEDVPARYGGDEFAIVMPQTTREEAEHAVERLMDLIDRTQVDLPDGARIPMPLRSWGVATFPVDGGDATDLVKNADARVYERKRARGRA